MAENRYSPCCFSVMERISSTELWATSNQRVTRRQILKIISIFPFLYLPPEIRNVIYGLCLQASFDGIEIFFDSYYHKFRKYFKAHRSFKHPIPRKKAPSIFLINRQIFHEAAALLRKGAIRFRHGLLRVKSITSVVSENILRQVSFIEISDAGHSILKGAILSESWHGYIRLITDLANVLAQGHRLEKLVVRLTDPKLLIHMTYCFQNHHACGFRDQLKRALSTLRLVRDVGKVVLIGFHHGFATELKRVMESKRSITFAGFPAEIRDIIWRFALDWPDILNIYTRVIAKSKKKGSVALFPPLKTPTALLLNRQYYAEARSVLLKKAFEIRFPAFDMKYPYAHALQFFQYVSRCTFQGIQHLEIRISDQQLFNYFKFTVFEALAESNKLRTLSLNIVDLDKAKIVNGGRRPYPDEKLHAYLKPLFGVRDLSKAEITGDLPLTYTEPLIAILQSKPFPGELLPEPKGIQSDSIVELEPVHRRRLT